VTYDCELDGMLLPLIFRNLKVRIESEILERNPRIDDRININITIFRPVSSNCLFMHLLKVPMRHSITAESFLGLPRHVGEVLLAQGGYLYHAHDVTNDPLLWLRSFGYRCAAFLRQQEIQYTPSPSVFSGEALLEEHMAISCFELLRAGGWSFKAFLQGNSTETDDISGVARLPLIFVELSNYQLHVLIQRVSRRTMTLLLTCLISHF
jgi:hypothetical protein